jgi:hypothetical protein
MSEQVPGRDADPYDFRLYFDGRQRRQVQAAAWVHAVDVWKQVELIDSAFLAPAAGSAVLREAFQSGSPKSGPAPSRLRLVSRTGEVFTGYALFRRLTRSLRLLWPLAIVTLIPGAARLGNRYYPPEAKEASLSPPSRKNADCTV